MYGAPLSNKAIENYLLRDIPKFANKAFTYLATCSHIDVNILIHIWCTNANKKTKLCSIVKIAQLMRLCLIHKVRRHHNAHAH